MSETNEPWFTQKQVAVEGHPVTYRVAGRGDPVVLVHGLAGSMRWWSNTAPALAQRYTVYLVDLPGFGSMRRYPGGFVLREASDWLAAWLEALGTGPAHLIGHSMGGYICLDAAAHHPEVVDRLVLIDPAGVPSGRSVLGHVWPLVQETLLSSPELLPLLVRDALRAGPFTVWNAANDLLSEDVRRHLHAVRAPTLLVWGDEDRLVPHSLAYVLQKEMPGSRLAFIKGSRHTPMFDRPLALNRIILSFLEGPPEEQ